MKKHCLILLFITALSHADSENLYGDGYLIVEKESLKQSDDLNQTIYRQIKDNYVGGGIVDLLKGTGWKLASVDASDPNIMRLYNQPYPQHKRSIGPATLIDSLKFIGGNAWELVIDPVNKLISYELASSYRCLEKHSCIKK